MPFMLWVWGCEGEVEKAEGEGNLGAERVALCTRLKQAKTKTEINIYKERIYLRNHTSTIRDVSCSALFSGQFGAI